MTADKFLWCVHVIGPDEVDPAPNFDTAERWAVNQNAKMRAYTIACGMANDPYWPETRCVVAVWPWDAESHAANLPRSIANYAKSNGSIFASGTLTEGGDVEQAPGESLSGPVPEEGDAHA